MKFPKTGKSVKFWIIVLAVVLLAFGSYYSLSGKKPPTPLDGLNVAKEKLGNKNVADDEKKLVGKTEKDTPATAPDSSGLTTAELTANFMTKQKELEEKLAAYNSKLAEISGDSSTVTAGPPKAIPLTAPAKGEWSSRIFVGLGKRIVFSLQDAKTVRVRLDAEREIDFVVSDKLQNLSKFKSIEFQSTTNTPVAIEYYFAPY